MTDIDAQTVIEQLNALDNGLLHRHLRMIQAIVAAAIGDGMLACIYVDVEMTPPDGDSVYATFRDGRWT